MAKLAYYFLVIPLSHLPLFILYIFTDFFYLLLISIIPYRKAVIERNITKSFPGYTEKQKRKLKRKFYRHFTDLLAESVKNLSISEKELKRRLTVKDTSLMDKLFDEGKNVILVSGHYNNWEWLVLGQGLLFKQVPFGIGKPMTSDFWDEKINKRRSRFGMNVVHSKNFKDELNKKNNQSKAILVLGDQSPGDSIKCYWLDFLNQKTSVLFGTEIMAHELDYAVVFFCLQKTKRGHYQMELQLITEEPKKMKWGEITEAHTSLLEKEIIKKPEYWLWSHKRWKRELPDDLNKLRTIQREKFNSKFGL